MAVVTLGPGAGAVPIGGAWNPTQDWRRTGTYTNSGDVVIGATALRIVSHDDLRLALCIRMAGAGATVRWPERQPTAGSALIDMAGASTVILTVFTHGPMVCDDIVVTGAGAGARVMWVEWLACQPLPETSLNGSLRRLADRCGLGKILNGV